MLGVTIGLATLMLALVKMFEDFACKCLIQFQT